MSGGLRSTAKIPTETPERQPWHALPDLGVASNSVVIGYAGRDANAVRKAAARSNPGADMGMLLFSIFAHRVAEEEEMSGHAGNVTAGVLAGAVYLVGGLSFSAMAGDEPPDFAPNPNIGWYAYNRIFIPPASGAGPVQQDPAHPYVSNDEFRVTGRQPTQHLADLNNPILQPWARDVMRKHNELVLAGKLVPSPTASCWRARSASRSSRPSRAWRSRLSAGSAWRSCSTCRGSSNIRSIPMR